MADFQSAAASQAAPHRVAGTVKYYVGQEETESINLISEGGRQYRPRNIAIPKPAYCVFFIDFDESVVVVVVELGS